MKSCKNCRNYAALDKNKYEYDTDTACCGGDDKYEACEYYEMAKEIVNTEEEIEKIYNNRYEAEATDVQPVSVIRKLQEHIKQRILETAFNNGGIYGEVAEDIADRIDIWVNEFGRTEND